MSTVNVDESGSFAAACLAGVGLGIFDSVEQPVRNWIKVERTFEPVLGRQRAYDDVFGHYLEFAGAAAEASRGLTAWKRAHSAAADAV